MMMMMMSIGFVAHAGQPTTRIRGRGSDNGVPHYDSHSALSHPKFAQPTDHLLRYVEANYNGSLLHSARETN